MRFVLCFAFTCIALGFAGTQRANAQYPMVAPQSYGQFAPGHAHHSHYCAPSASPYYSGYGAPVMPYPPAVSYPPVYGANAIYAPPAVPQSSIYYSNSTYYGRPPAHTHHGWHPGHYLLGHH